MSTGVLKDAFILTYDRMRRYQGEWHVETKPMFPNYIFLESDDEKALADELKQYGSIVRIQKADNVLLHVQREEEQFLKYLCGRNHHMGMSKGVIRNGITRITDGPLKGLENHIRKIDRHKRLARVQTPKGHLQESILAGLEIVEKS